MATDTAPGVTERASVAADPALLKRLRDKARRLRHGALALNNRTLHAGAALSSADIVAALFYHVLRLRPHEPDWPGRDVFINSRGHACEPIYVAMADLGFFPASDLARVEEKGCHLHGLTATTTPGVEFSCGSLGQGLSLGVGVALGLRAQGKTNRVFVVSGDGECQEGSVWEAVMTAGKYRLDNLTLVVDRNRYQSNDRGTEQVMPLEPLDAKFEAFGFAARRIDGHDMDALVRTLAQPPLEPGRPSAVIAETIKGRGVSFLESGHVHCGRFGRDYDLTLLEAALRELEEPGHE